MSAQAPLDRLSPVDLYLVLDWVRDNWDDPRDEMSMTRQLQRARRLLEQLPTHYWERARPLLEELGRCRLSASRPWREKTQALRLIVSDWDNSRPPLLTCPRCGIEQRGHPALTRHLWLVHDEGEAAQA